MNKAVLIERISKCDILILSYLAKPALGDVEG